MVLDVYPAELGAAGGVRADELPALRQLRREGRVQAAAAAAAVDDRDGRRLPLQDREDRPRPAQGDPAGVRLRSTVTDPNGKPVTFAPWYGALAHAIFFQEGHARLLPHARLQPRRGRLHERARRQQGHGQLGDAGTSDRRRPRCPLPGTWRLFLQIQQDGQILTAPFTLRRALTETTALAMLLPHATGAQRRRRAPAPPAGRSLRARRPSSRSTVAAALRPATTPTSPGTSRSSPGSRSRRSSSSACSCSRPCSAATALRRGVVRVLLPATSRPLPGTVAQRPARAREPRLPRRPGDARAQRSRGHGSPPAALGSSQLLLVLASSLRWPRSSRSSSARARS